MHTFNIPYFTSFIHDNLNSLHFVLICLSTSLCRIKRNKIKLLTNGKAEDIVERREEIKGGISTMLAQWSCSCHSTLSLAACTLKLRVTYVVLTSVCPDGLFNVPVNHPLSTTYVLSSLDPIFYLRHPRWSRPPGSCTCWAFLSTCDCQAFHRSHLFNKQRFF